MTAFRLILAAALAVPAVAACDSGPPDAAYFARRMQSKVGERFGPARIASIEAEDNVLVVTFDGPENWRAGYPSFMMSAPFLDGFCSAPKSEHYFADGRKLRLDTLDRGRSRIRGHTMSRCRDV